MNSTSIFGYNSIFLRAKIPGMRGLYIGVPNSCSYVPESSNFNYIISVCLISFWNLKCSIGNIYFPQTRWTEVRLNAFSELDKWLRYHNKDKALAVLMGDFNMPFEKRNKYIVKKISQIGL